MPLGNYAEPEVAVAAVVVGAVASPSIRRAVRTSVIYGLAGALMAFDRTSNVVQGVVKGVRSGVSTIAPEGATAEAGAATPPPPPSPVA